jgi:hypothetical protein
MYDTRSRVSPLVIGVPRSSYHRVPSQEVGWMRYNMAIAEGTVEVIH